MKNLIDKLEREHKLEKHEWIKLIENDCGEYLFERAHEVRLAAYGRDVYIRGLIEFTNYCRNNCLYCGIRSGNKNAQRYRLSKDQILSCCEAGYELGFRTFVLQGGEDPWYNDEKMVQIISAMRKSFPDCAITLSFGEQPRDTYQKYFDAGANRYLLRHETANHEHYSMLHPRGLTLENRLKCLSDLKEIGFQFGSGFMVGSPYQTNEHLANDMLLLQELKPHMVGIGPFIPHHDTPFGEYPMGSVDKTVKMLALTRLLLPLSLIPATTALATLDPMGREKGLAAGANVVMPNLSPTNVREKYTLYDGKLCTGAEAADALNDLKAQVAKAGYRVVVSRGDCKAYTKA